MSIELERPPENLSVYQPEIVTLETPEHVDKYAFDMLEAQVYANKHSVLTLPTGNSPVGMYKLIREAYQKGLDLGGLTSRNLDEYWPISKKHPLSYDRFMRENLFDYVNISEAQWHVPNGEAPDAYEEVARYQEVLKQTGRADLAILGLGPGLTCHMGFNERGSTLDSRTRLVWMAEETLQANMIKGVFETAITQGVADILDSKKIMVIVKGLSKAPGLKRTLEGSIDSDAPAAFLRLHPYRDVTFVVDKEAASLLDR